MKDWSKEFTTSEIRNLEERFEKKKERVGREGRHLEFSLTIEDWMMMGHKLLGRGTCDYTDMEFKYPGIQTGFNPQYPSVERIDDKLGYVRGNVCVVLRRANQLKDVLVDKKTAITIIEKLDREIVQAMMLNMSKDHLEKLKTKYIPTEEESTVELNQHMEAVEEQHNEAYLDLTADITVEVAEESPVVEEKIELPEDVAVALAYANYCKSFHEVGMPVSVTYAQFKAKYMRTTCAISGEKLASEPKAILILDFGMGFAKDNFIVVSKTMETAMTQLMINTKMSLPKVVALLNKVV